MKFPDLVLEVALVEYLQQKGFNVGEVIWTNYKKGKVVIGNHNNPLQELYFTLSKGKNPFKTWGHTYVHFEDAEYLGASSFEYMPGRGAQKPLIRPYEDIGFYGQKSPNLKAVYKKVPSLKKLVLANFLFGAMNSMMELSVNARLFMNLQDIAVLSMMTDASLTIPGQWLGEKRGTKFINDVVAANTPAQKIAQLYAQHCSFAEKRDWRVRLDLEDHLRQNYFEQEHEFNARYLANYDAVMKIVKAPLLSSSSQQKANDIAKLLFGPKAPTRDKDPELFMHFRNLTVLDHQAVESAVREFYGQISAIPANIPNYKKLWKRRQYTDLVRNLCSVVEHGYYEEMDDELRTLKEGEQTIKSIKSRDAKTKKRLRKDEVEGLGRIAKEYQAFLLANQRYFHEGEENLSRITGILDAVKKGKNIEASSRKYLETFLEEYKLFLLSVKSSLDADDVPDYIDENLGHANRFMSECVLSKEADPKDAISVFEGYIDTLKEVTSQLSRQTLEHKVASMRSFMTKLAQKEVNAQTEELDDILNYIDARQFAMKKAGVSEKKVYCSLAEAQKKFLQQPIAEYTRDINAEELQNITELCFKEMDRANVGNLSSVIGLAAMIGISEMFGEIPGGRLVNALGWGAPIALKSIYESYCSTKGGRVMAYYVLSKYRIALKQEGVDVESAYSELDSVLSVVYLAGYMAGTSAGMPFLYATTPDRQWPVLISMSTSALLVGAAYKTWLDFEKSAKSEMILPTLPAKPSVNPPAN